MQHNKFVDNKDVKIYCATNQFPGFQFLGPHNNPHCLHRLGNHYHMCFDTKIVHGTYMMHRIPCVFPPCTFMLDQPWDPGMPSQKQSRYQPVKYYTYWPVLGYFKNWNITQLPHKATSSE